jgi:cell division protease FtsH
MGIKHKKNLTEDERKRIAYHETGHLITLYLLHPTDDVFKASIMSRGGTLGSVLHQPREELFTTNKEQILANVKVCLGGYAAEKLFMGSTSTGCSDDFGRATNYAHAMIWNYGMGGADCIGDFSALPKEQISETLKSKLNNDTIAIVQNCAREVEDLLKREQRVVDRFVQELLLHEELEYDEIERIFKEEGKTSIAAKHPTTAIDN